MLKSISKTFFTGLFTILPVALTLYFLYWLVVSTEYALGGMIRLMLQDDQYWPGMGTIVGLLVVLLVGLLMNAYMVRRLFSWGEQILYHLPLVKSVYRAIRDFFNYFSPAKEKEFEQVVSVTIGDTGMKVIGFISQAIPENLPEDFREEDNILVYIPLSYMIGGYAVLMPRSSVRPLNMSMEEAMRFTLTAGVTSSSK